MLPVKRAPCKPGIFFGKSYPRALGKVDNDHRLIRAPDAVLPNNPLLREILILLISPYF
jgi:hypothetical protein